MSSTYVNPASIGRVNRPSRRRAGLLGLGAALAGVTAVGGAVAIFLSPTEAPPVAAPAVVDTRPAVPASPIGGYAVVEGPFGYAVVGRDAALSIAPTDGFVGDRPPHDVAAEQERIAALSGQAERLTRTPAQVDVVAPPVHVDSRSAVEPASGFGHRDVTQEGYVCGSDGCVYVYAEPAEIVPVFWDYR